jgi:glycosyl hydrolase family 99
MILRNTNFDQKRKTNKARMAVDRLLQTLIIGMGFSFLFLFVTACTSKKPSGLTKPSGFIASPTAPVTQPSPSVQFQPRTDTPDNSVPVLAYYYIWFDSQSWDRAKTDYPLLGRYSSDDADVMRQHIDWAKSAGIDGFIVSWKGTDRLNHRLDQLVKIAEEKNFKLAIIYEGLDFERNPLPPEQVDADLNYFMQHYADHPAFDLFTKPMVIWSGTWKYSVDEIKSVTQTKRNSILVLASEKNVNGYQRLSDYVDGDAYYWSSVNPDTHPGHLDKLTAMGETIHERGGIWIAPAAPGFDARLVGGTSVVERKNGQTLKTELNTAFQSYPDAVGLISWNEFSENSHIEPSQNYGDLYLKVLRESNLVLPTP